MFHYKEFIIKDLHTKEEIPFSFTEEAWKLRETNPKAFQAMAKFLVYDAFKVLLEKSGADHDSK